MLVFALEQAQECITTDVCISTKNIFAEHRGTYFTYGTVVEQNNPDVDLI